MASMAEEAAGFSAVIDAEDQRFLAPRSMSDEIRRACAETGQARPSSTGEPLRCVDLSLAEDYASTLDELEGLAGDAVRSLNIVGGGSQDQVLNQLTADACGLAVAIGPTEGTALGIDFNPTVFSHPMMKDGLSLSSPDDDVRGFWIDHCIACRRISQRIGEELGDKVLCNVWIPDGFKDVPADRLGPRRRLKASLDAIFSEECPNVIDCVESKFFAIGVESYTTGSNEFYTAYAASHLGADGKPDVYNLMDAGHYHPSEYVSDKISAMLLYFDYVPLHVTRPVNWDSDHVVNFDDETREICKEIVRTGAMDRVIVGLDFFDASINRVAAWVIGSRAFEKALLFALLQPNDELRDLQDAGDFTKKMALMEEAKTMPFSEVWNEYCHRAGVPLGMEWYDDVKAYETEVLSKRV